MYSLKVADKCNLKDISCDIINIVFKLFDNLPENGIQINELITVINTLYSSHIIDNDAYQGFATKITQYSSKLSHKPDQCIMIAKCTRLFWKEDDGYKDSKLVLECLQKSLKVADNCSGSNTLELFIDILNEYIFYYNQQCDSVY